MCCHGRCPDYQDPDPSDLLSIHDFLEIQISKDPDPSDPSDLLSIHDFLEIKNSKMPNCKP